MPRDVGGVVDVYTQLLALLQAARVDVRGREQVLAVGGTIVDLGEVPLRQGPEREARGHEEVREALEDRIRTVADEASEADAVGVDARACEHDDSIAVPDVLVTNHAVGARDDADDGPGEQGSARLHDAFEHRGFASAPHAPGLEAAILGAAHQFGVALRVIEPLVAAHRQVQSVGYGRAAVRDGIIERHGAIADGDVVLEVGAGEPMHVVGHEALGAEPLFHVHQVGASGTAVGEGEAALAAAPLLRNRVGAATLGEGGLRGRLLRGALEAIHSGVVHAGVGVGQCLCGHGRSP